MMPRQFPSQSRPLLLALLISFTPLLTLSGWSFQDGHQHLTITEQLRRDVQFLTSPELTGRGVDTPGIKLARDYLAADFARAGLRPGGDDGSFFQRFDVAVGVTVDQPSSLTLDQNAPLDLNTDWIPLGLSKSDNVDGGLVFAGYGITAKENGYDDYTDVNVKGKIVLILRYEPPPKDEKSPFKKPPEYSVHAALRTKANNARDHGAVGMILVDLNHDNEEQPELLSTKNSLWRGGNSLVAAQVRRGVLEKWLNSRGVSLSGLKEKIDRTGKPGSMALPGALARLQVTLKENHDRAENVIGILPGADSNLRDQRVVIGAHYDHLGFGHFGALDRQAEGKVHPGADDNASGTAVLLELARRLAKLPVKPERTIVFTAFSGEELGLYGSRHYIEHTDSISAINAMINLDMVGRLRENRVTVFGARSGENLSDLVARNARGLGLDITDSNDVGRSDHMSFYSKKIPVLHFFTGTHGDYHRATDTWEKLNIEGMAKISDLVLVTALEIANSKDPIRFVSLPSRSPGSIGTARGVGVYLGTIPDYGAVATGVRLAGVSSGSPAAEAGLREGDVIVRLDDKDIQNIEDLTDALQAHKSGDQVSVVVLRAGATITLRATLSSRG
ncbi:MAG TPA: M20/M25/M40 family metallo-hydrolase [Candidatus Binatia bacterium]|nr:M20/M25/M40 family metallo-hydrolase [Candidatus Binatia bacterium]